MVDQLDNRNQGLDTLPPFSFSKKPIHASSLQCNKSVISDIIPSSSSTSDGSPRQSKNKEKEDRLGDGDSIFSDINYDDQIRAPRMSNISHYTYKEEGFKRKDNFVGSTKLKESLNSDKDKKIIEEDKEQDLYSPATFDLTQTTRRFSAPSEGDVHSSYDFSNYPYTSLMYSKPRNELSNTIESQNFTQSEKESLLRALKNLSSNSITEEREASKAGRFRLKHRPQVGICTPLSEMRGTNLQQVYQLKKPLCVPAVLRPHSEVSNSPESQSNLPSLEASPQKFNYTVSDKIESLPSDLANSSEVSLAQTCEPTHRHWKPNNYTTHCMKCFSPLGNFFIPLRKRRHHCRFCGLIFCPDCMWHNGEEEVLSSSGESSHILASNAVLLDTGARFVVPILTNLVNGQTSCLNGFKNSKVCRDCALNYQSLVVDINANLHKFFKAQNITDSTLPFVFIENPHLVADLKADAKGASSSGDLNPQFARKPSNSNVPADWTWSSF